MKYTNARYPDKINDLVDNDGNVHIPGGVGSLPAIPLEYSFEELQVENSDARKYFSDLVLTLCSYFSANINYGLLRVVTTDNVYIEGNLNNPDNNESEETALMAWKDDKLYIAYGIFSRDIETGALESFDFFEFREVEFPAPPAPFEHKMIITPSGKRDWDVLVDNAFSILDNTDFIQLFRSPLTRGASDDKVIGQDPQIYIQLPNPGVIQSFLETPAEGSNYTLVPGEKHLRIEGQQFNLFRLPTDKEPCPAETLGLGAYEIYYNEDRNMWTYYWDGNAEEITWYHDK